MTTADQSAGQPAGSRPRLEPDASHPITVEPTGSHVVVRRGDTVIAETDAALTLREASYPPVQYVPLADVDPAVLEPTDHATYCPYKGAAGYYSLVVADGSGGAAGDRAENAVWTYRAPYPAVAAIADHVAFYPDQVEISVA